MLETVEATAEVFTNHTADKNNPHNVTKEQVGLGNVDNTADIDKPVSNATASAITTLKQAANSMFHQIQSAVQTLDQTNQQEHQDTLTLLDSKITEAKGLITALDNKIISATATLKTLFSEADTAIKNEVTTAYQAKDTELQAAINSKAASNHNHDSVYAKIGSLGLTDGSVKSNHIADNAITSAKIAGGTIVNGDIANATITGAKLVNKTITAKQIADNTITAAQLAPNSIGSSELGYTPAKRADVITATELFTKAGVSGQITTAALVTGINKSMANFRGTTVTGWITPAQVSDLPADNLLITILAYGADGIYMEARTPFGDNSLWIGSSNNGTWGGWRQARNTKGQVKALEVQDDVDPALFCSNVGVTAATASANISQTGEPIVYLSMGGTMEGKVQLAVGVNTKSLYIQVFKNNGSSDGWRKI